MRTTKILLLINKAILGGIVVFFPLFLIYVFIFVFYSGAFLEAQEAKKMPTKICSQFGKTAVSGFRNKTSKGFTYFVKTPTNYQAEKSWPLLIVFSPSINGFLMERYTGLTSSVTKAGFLVAYVDSVSMHVKTILQLTEIVAAIEDNFCIDNERIYLAGHSDGATISQALNLFSETQHEFAGFISSAGGFRKEDLSEFECPENKHVMLLQNSGDKHFENFSSSTLSWWLACNVCEEKVKRVSEGCIYYEACEKGRVVFCEQPGSHLSWPRRHIEIENFLSDYSGF